MSKYNPKRFEKKWLARWAEKKVFEPNLKQSRKPFYNLMMFPYPSAEGLHIGNVYAFVGSDVYGRKKRMEGFDVFEPIGLDGFGIHSENYALKIKTHPMKQAKKSEKRFYKQLETTANAFVWEEKLETYDPEYYKWTQWIFIQMFKNGLAYRKKADVNWCSSCKTVLADEQVISGECERCGDKAIKKELEQWFLRITNYAEKLLNDLENLDWSEKVKISQKNWIGKSEGAAIKFKITNQNLKFSEIGVFTTRLDTLAGATYLVLAPEYKIIKNLEIGVQNLEEIKNYIEETKKETLEEQRIAKEKTGVELKGIKAINPLTKEEIPVWVSDYVLTEYGTGAIMAVPAHDQRDFEFAKKFNLPIKMVICPNYPEKICPILDKAYEGGGRLIASEEFNGLTSQNAKEEIIKRLEKEGMGRKEIRYRLRDWLISRQRYWGPPIPMIFCGRCGWQPVPEKDLPVLLPYIKDFKPLGKGESPLAAYEKFYKTKCPNCGEEAKRETDVSDTFLDSAWYYFRYPDAKNKKKIFDKKIIKRWLPVDMYIGGAEHSVLHLLYTRFIAKVFYDWGLADFNEPFKKFRAHGLIIKDGAKMSKSKGNIVAPDWYIKEFGSDVLRLYLMFLGPFEQGGDFRDEGILGPERFLKRVWKLSLGLKVQNSKRQSKNKKFESLLHQTIKKVSEDIDNLHYNTAVSQLMILFNAMEEETALDRKTFEIFVKLLAPLAPLITEELWQRLGYKKSIHLASWPEYDRSKIKTESFKLIIQINGRTRDKIELSDGLTDEELKRAALSSSRVKEFLGPRTPKRFIIVPKRLVNIVI